VSGGWPNGESKGERLDRELMELLLGWWPAQLGDALDQQQPTELGQASMSDGVPAAAMAR
jgi:hypothetical protein